MTIPFTWPWPLDLHLKRGTTILWIYLLYFILIIFLFCLFSLFLPPSLPPSLSPLPGLRSILKEIQQHSKGVFQGRPSEWRLCFCQWPHHSNQRHHENYQGHIRITMIGFIITLWIPVTLFFLHYILLIVYELSNTSLHPHTTTLFCYSLNFIAEQARRNHFFAIASTLRYLSRSYNSRWNN